MTKKRELVELNQNIHGDLKVVPGAAISQASKQHIIGVKVNELGQALSAFPVFLMRSKQPDSDSPLWALSAITSFEQNVNLFVVDGQWDSVYVPSAMRTFPMFLTVAGQGKEGYSVGINPESSVFSKESGDALFDEDGNATDYLSSVTAQLDADIKNEVFTYRFTKQLDELGLIREVNVVLRFADNNEHTLKGLHTINEEKFNELSDETILALRENGFLVSIYAMLFSVFQVNSLAKRHNLKDGTIKIVDVKVEPHSQQVAH